MTDEELSVYLGFPLWMRKRIAEVGMEHQPRKRRTVVRVTFANGITLDTTISKVHQSEFLAACTMIYDAEPRDGTDT